MVGRLCNDSRLVPVLHSQMPIDKSMYRIGGDTWLREGQSRDIISLCSHTIGADAVSVIRNSLFGSGQWGGNVAITEHGRREGKEKGMLV